MSNQPISNTSVSLKIKTIVIVVIAISAFIFSIGVVYSKIIANATQIVEMKPLVKRIPVLETQIQFIVKGMEKLTNTKYNGRNRTPLSQK